MIAIKRSLLGLLLLLLPAFANAQMPVEPMQPQFRITTLDSRIRGAYYIADRGQPRYLKLSPGYIAGPSAFKAGRQLHILKNDEQGTPSRIANADIPPALQYPLILLLNIPQQQPDGTALPCSALVLDESLQAFPLNSVRFINLSAQSSAVSLAGSPPQQIAAGQQLVVPFTPPKSGKNYRALHVALQSPAGEWERVTSAEDNEIYLEAGIRLLVIIRTPSAAGDSPRITPVTILQDNATTHLLQPQRQGMF